MNKALVALFVVASTSASAWAQMSPVGLWRTIDDVDGKPKSEVRVVENAGVISGKVERILDPSKQDEKCVDCKDDRKDQLVLGMEIIRGLKKADGKDVWEGGTVLKPDEGKIYKASMTPVEGGKKIELRGYIGFFYKTQTWIRIQ